MRKILFGALGGVLLGCGSSDGGGDSAGGTTGAQTSAMAAPADVGGDDAGGTDAGGGTDGGADTGTGGGQGSTGSDTGAGTAGDTGDGVVTFDEVSPVFANRCGVCHTTASLGGHSIGSDDLMAAYADSQKTAVNPVCGGVTIGQCTLIRIKDGSMPQLFGCSGDPEADADVDGCTTQEDQDLIQAWIDDGQLGPI